MPRKMKMERREVSCYLNKSSQIAHKSKKCCDRGAPGDCIKITEREAAKYDKCGNCFC